MFRPLGGYKNKKKKKKKKNIYIYIYMMACPLITVMTLFSVLCVSGGI